MEGEGDMSKKSSRHESKGDKSLLIMILIFALVVIFCCGAVIGVITLTGNNKTLHAPQTPTPYVLRTAEPAATDAATEQPTENNLQTDPPSPSPNSDEDEEIPVFTKITASSVREAYRGNNVYITYTAKNLTDNNSETAWTPEESDTNPWVLFKSSSKQKISGFEIENGYSKNENLYYQNMRAKNIIIACGGEDYKFVLKDSGCGIKQTVTLPEPVLSESVKITVADTYAGNKYNELCISEITPF